MNLVWFLTIFTTLSLILGEFGRYPFGQSIFAIRITDILLATTLFFLIIWQFGIKKKILFPVELKWIVLFWAVAAISLITSGIFSGTFHLLRYILYSLSFWLGYSLIKSKLISILTLIKLFIGIGISLTILGFLQLIIFPNFNPLTEFGYDPHQMRLSSTFLDPNFLGAFLNICLILLLYLFFQGGEKKLLIFIALFIFSIALTFSRSAYLMLLLEALILGTFSFRKVFLIVLIVGLLCILFIPRVGERIVGGFNLDKSASERIDSWNKGLTIFFQYPMLGVGFNNLREEMVKKNYIQVFSKEGGHSGAGVDSSLIFVLATTGILGSFTYLIWWFLIIKKEVVLLVKKGINNSQMSIFVLAILGGLFINSFFVNSLFFPPIFFTVYLILGAINGQRD